MNDNTLITRNKSNANGYRYANLFLKHVPQLDAGKKILLMSIGNEDCVFRLIEKNPVAEYVIYDNEFICKGIEMLNEFPCKISYVYDGESLENVYNISMKFDCIIMNPPYNKNLHLKILAEAIKHLKDENSVCVNLSPVRWLQDPTVQFKDKSDYSRFNDSIVKHINALNVISSKDAEAFFKIGLPFNLGIYECNLNNHAFKCPYTENQILIADIIKRYSDTIDKHCSISIPNNWAIVLSWMCGGSGGRNESSDGSWFDFRKKSFSQYCYHNNKRLDNGLSYFENRKNNCWGNVKPKAEQLNVQFKTENEAHNFFNSCNTIFFKFAFKSIMVDIHVHPEFLPWLGDAINPRTGKKGYESEWTDKDFYTFFNITPDEQKIIEETMAKYK